jgi:hypothetical protein
MTSNTSPVEQEGLTEEELLDLVATTAKLAKMTAEVMARSPEEFNKMAQEFDNKSET